MSESGDGAVCVGSGAVERGCGSCDVVEAGDSEEHAAVVYYALRPNGCGRLTAA